MVCGDFWFSGLIDKIWGCKIEKEEEEKGDVKEKNDLLGLGYWGAETCHSQEACREGVAGFRYWKMKFINC